MSIRRFCLALALCLGPSLCLAQDPAPISLPTPQETAKEAESQPVVMIDVVAGIQKPIIYFYRIKQFAGSALEPSVYCDDKELARMDNGRFFGVTLEPGKHTCRMGDKQTGFELDMKPGQVYYARINIDTGFWKGRGRLTLMQNEQGSFELKKVAPLGVSKVKNRELVTIHEGTSSKQ